MCRQDVCEREDLSDGCGVSAPSSILFGYLLLTCIEHLDRGVPSEHSCWVFSVADCSPGSPYVTYCSLGGSRTSKAWICGSCSNWLHLEVSFSVLTTSYEVSIRQVYLYAFMLWNCKKKKQNKNKKPRTHTLALGVTTSQVTYVGHVFHRGGSRPRTAHSHPQSGVERTLTQGHLYTCLSSR